MSTAFRAFTRDFAMNAQEGSDDEWNKEWEQLEREATLKIALALLQGRTGEVPAEAIKVVSGAPPKALLNVIVTGELLRASDLSAVLARLRAASTPPWPEKRPPPLPTRPRRSAQAAGAPPAGHKQRQWRRLRKQRGA
jgi:hypothetical protein